jgi:hypothetical protein
MAMALTDWPTGEAGDWSDLKINNDLYYGVEYSTLLNINTPFGQQKLVSIFPNPVEHYFKVNNESVLAVETIEILNSNGKLTHRFDAPGTENNVVDQLPQGGMYC